MTRCGAALSSALTILALSLVGAASGADESKPKMKIDPKWVFPHGEMSAAKIDVQIDRSTPKAVTVLVDLMKLSPLQIVTVLVVPVQFLDEKGKVIATEKFEFTDQKVPLLRGGKKYKRSFEHGVKSFDLAKGKLHPLPAEGVVLSDIQATDVPGLIRQQQERNRSTTD